MTQTNPLWPPFPVPVIDTRTTLMSQPWILFIQALLDQGFVGSTSVQSVSGGGSVSSSGGTNPVITLGPSGVAAGTYGDATHVGQFTVSSDGILTFAQDVAIAGVGAGGQYMPVHVGGLAVTLGDVLVAVAWTP